MEILVTGGGGFVGRHLARRLIEGGHTVTAFDKADAWPQGAAGGASPPVRRITGDLLDAAAVRSAIEAFSPRVVVHAAALVGPTLSLEEPLLTARLNLDGTIHVLEACLAAGVGRLIFVSTEEVYGQFRHDPVPEDDPMSPLNPYAITKAAAEWYVDFYHRHHRLDGYVARTSWVYGPGFPRLRLETKIIADALEGRESLFRSGAEHLVDYTYVDDLVDGFRLLIEHPRPGHRVYNIASGLSQPIREVAAILQRLLPAARVTLGPGLLETGPGLPMPQKGGLDISRARQDLGYAPQVSLETGLSRCVEAARAGRSHHPLSPSRPGPT
ncbi:MAG: hypothetical protein A2X52_16105 [Candidatus Rokubacteria bacterium GWC2_70_16]|nr:MAG: hypothetical protein A2X52_16105 [Candidatus Rokubacteria bacterium GWC2_70_16]